MLFALPWECLPGGDVKVYHGAVEETQCSATPPSGRALHYLTKHPETFLFSLGEMQKLLVHELRV